MPHSRDPKPQLNINLFIHSLNKHVYFLLPLTSLFVSTLASIPNPPIAAREILTKCCSVVYTLWQRETRYQWLKGFYSLHQETSVSPERQPSSFLLTRSTADLGPSHTFSSCTNIKSHHKSLSDAAFHFHFILYWNIFLILGVQSYSLGF